MSRSTRLYLALAALALAAAPLRAQIAPDDWNQRTMTGASLELMTLDGEGFMMAALRSTHLGNGTVTPDVSLGLGYTQGVLVSSIDLGVGAPLRARGLLVAFSAGPSLLGAFAVGDGGSGAAAVIGLHGRASLVFPMADKFAIRFDVGRRIFFSNGENVGLWVFGFGVTGLGSHRRATP